MVKSNTAFDQHAGGGTIERLRASGELSLFIAEQNVTFALRHANSIHLLEQGQIVWSGPTHRFADEVGHKVL